MKAIDLFSGEAVAAETTVMSASLCAVEKKAFIDNNKVMVGDAPYINMTLDEAVKIVEHNPKNRLINKDHVSKLKKQLATFQENIPALTLNTETFHLIDGNQRFEAYKINGNNVNIVFKLVSIAEENELEAIIAANLNSKGWTLENLVTAYNDGDNTYSRLVELAKQMTVLCMAKGKLKYRNAAAIITGEGCEIMLKKGLFNATEEQFAEAITVQNELVEFLKVMGLKTDAMAGSWVERMAIEWHAYRKKYNFTFNEWLAGCKECRKELVTILSSHSKDKKPTWQLIFDLIKGSAFELKALKAA